MNLTSNHKHQMHKAFLMILSLIVWSPQQTIAQDDEENRDMTLNGYIKYMHTVIVPPVSSSEIITDNFLHNRLNYAWYVNENLTFNVSMRNRFFWGEFKRNFGPIFDQMGEDSGYLDMSFLWYNGESSALHTVFDRLNLVYQKNNWEITVGRHRVNWGMALVWNANDIFNTYSFFDFDYEERPGTDVIQVNYYTGSTSSLSVVYAPADSLAGSTFATKYQFNAHQYDFQLMAGYQRKFYVAGVGWAGDIKGAGFKGESTYFIPEHGEVGDNQLVGSVDLDYTLGFGIYLHAAYLFNSDGINAENGDYAAFYLDRDLSVQTLSPAMHNLFFEVSGQVSPIVFTGLASMLNPSDGSWFIGPNVNWSAAQNLDLLITAQLFRGNPQTLYGDGGSLIFGRFKYSF